MTGVRAPAALELIRRLGCAGHDVIAADSVHLPLGRFSRYVRKYYHVPGPRMNPAAFAEALRNIVQSENVDVLLPSCEEIYCVARHREILAEYCEVFCPGFALLETLHNKECFAKLTHSIGGDVVAPESVLIADVAHLKTFLSNSRAWVFKPIYSRFAARTLIRPSCDALERMQFTPGNPWMAQRFVAGREISSYSIAVRGRLTAHTIYYSHHRSGQAAGIYFSTERNTDATRFVECIVSQLEFTGQIAFDFIECADTGRVFVLECNPRATSGVHLLKPDFNLDHALRGDSTQIPDIPVESQPKMLGAAMIAQSIGPALRRCKLSVWRRDFVAADDVISAADDRLPMLGQFALLAEMFGRGLRSGNGMMAAMTADLEWNGEPLE